MYLSARTNQGNTVCITTITTTTTPQVTKKHYKEGREDLVSLPAGKVKSIASFLISLVEICFMVQELHSTLRTDKGGGGKGNTDEGRR